MTKSARHEGEQAVQRRAGEGAPEWGSPMFGPEIPAGFGHFMAEQRLAAIGAADDDGAIWATVLTGESGFIETLDDRTVVLHAAPPSGDPLHRILDAERDLGMVVMSPQTRRRVRVNGRAVRDGDRVVVRTDQVLGNCPKYLQTRTVAEVLSRQGESAVRTGAALDAEAQRWITDADTFFIASWSPEHGADASHRGGRPGFVTVAGPNRLVWPDYTGNSFYMTLGNLELNPRCGLVFLDWARGHTLQLTGTGRIDWTRRHAEAVPGALRLVEFDVERVVRVDHASALRWELHAYSSNNPPTTSSQGRT